MNAVKVAGWVSLGTGILIVIFAGISLLTGRNMFGFTHVVNFFHAANSFFLISVALFLSPVLSNEKKPG
ncbi:MAG TPA: hypothetical protein P5257_10405 [Bacteroidales bacterium]|nr:hypothetical protein [Bacteroidales bacterium]HRR94205.1 hypothetical protein [Bacteroidales bacterium]HRT90518.1 hypothetical protein [Bacteroidales bacterium]